MIKQKSAVLISIALATGIVAIGCGSNAVNNVGGGGHSGTSSSSKTSSGSKSSSSAGSSSSSSAGSSSSSSSGAVVNNCAANGKTYCTALSKCSTTVLSSDVLFTYLWETEAICEAEYAKTCNASTKLNAKVVDPAACLAKQTATCQALLGGVGNIPECLPATGTKDVDAACTATSDCKVGLSCWAAQDPNRTKCFLPPVCTAALTDIGGLCSDSTVCDTDHGVQCVLKSDALKPGGHTTDSATCEHVTYGGLNAACAVGTEIACASDFNCVSGVCKPYAQLGDPCSATNPCDPMLASVMTCGIKAGATATQTTCNLKVVAVVGSNSKCGPTTDATVQGLLVACDDYAYCDNQTKKCLPRNRLGEGCTTDVVAAATMGADSCWPGEGACTGAKCTIAPSNCP